MRICNGVASLQCRFHLYAESRDELGILVSLTGGVQKLWSACEITVGVSVEKLHPNQFTLHVISNHGRFLQYVFKFKITQPSSRFFFFKIMLQEGEFQVDIALLDMMFF